MKTKAHTRSSDIPSWWLSSKACALILAAGGSLALSHTASAAPFVDNPATPEVGESEVAPTEVNQEATGFDRKLVVGFSVPETERSMFRAVPTLLENAAQAPAEGQSAYLYKTNLYYVKEDTFEIMAIVDVSEQLTAEPALVEKMVVGYQVPVEERPYLIERSFKGKMAAEKPPKGQIVRVLNGGHVVWLDEQTYEIKRIKDIAAAKENGNKDSAPADSVKPRTGTATDAGTPDAKPKEASSKEANPPKANPKEADPKEANPKEADPKEAR